MMLPELKPRDRKALRVGVVVVMILLVARYTPTALAWRSSFARGAESRRDSAMAAAGALSTHRRNVGLVRALKAEVESGEARMLSASSASSAVAELAALVSDAAVSAGLRLDVLLTLPDTFITGQYTAVRVRGDGASDLQGIVNLLQLLECDSLRLRVRELQVVQPAPSAPDDEPEVLRTSFTVEVLMHRNPVRP